MTGFVRSVLADGKCGESLGDGPPSAVGWGMHGQGLCKADLKALVGTDSRTYAKISTLFFLKI